MNKHFIKHIKIRLVFLSLFEILSLKFINFEQSGVPKLPCVVKIGSSSSGLGKVKIENINQYQDIRSVLMITDKYCTIEPFIDAKCDFILQKIGNNYKTFT